MRKIFFIFLISLYVFGITRIALVYSTHEFFHEITEEHQPADTDCEDHCAIIKVAENSENSTETKFFKISSETISSHLLHLFNNITNPYKEIVYFNTVSFKESELFAIYTPPPKA